MVWLIQEGWRLIIHAGDGNCFFRAVAHQLGMNEEGHLELRARCCDYIEKNKEHYDSFLTDNEGSIDDHIAEMSQEGKYATNIEVAAMSEVLERPIHAYYKAEEGVIPTVIDPEGCAATGPPINLVHRMDCHYDGIVPEEITSGK